VTSPASGGGVRIRQDTAAQIPNSPLPPIDAPGVSMARWLHLELGGMTGWLAVLCCAVVGRGSSGLELSRMMLAGRCTPVRSSASSRALAACSSRCSRGRNPAVRVARSAFVVVRRGAVLKFVAKMAVAAQHGGLGGCSRPLISSMAVLALQGGGPAEGPRCRVDAAVTCAQSTGSGSTADAAHLVDGVLVAAGGGRTEGAASCRRDRTVDGEVRSKSRGGG